MIKTVKIPVVYTGYVGRSTVAKSIVGVVDHDIELRPVHEDEAPLAFRATFVEGSFRSADYRFHEGRLYRRWVRERTDNPESVPNKFYVVGRDIWENAMTVIRGFSEPTVPPKSRFIPFPKGMEWAAVATMLTEATANVAQAPCAQDEIAVWRRRADQVARKVIVVNDRPYELSTEPMYYVDFKNPQRVMFLHRNLEDPFEVARRDYKITEIGANKLQMTANFGPDEWELAAAAYEAWRREDRDARDPYVHIERLLDSYVCSDVAEMESFRIARLLLNDVSYGITNRSRGKPMMLQEETSDLFDAVVTLKHAVKMEGSELDVDLDVVMERVIELAEETTKNRPLVRPEIRNAVAYALDRWRDRPIFAPDVVDRFKP